MAEASNLVRGKRGLILGVANTPSPGSGIASAGAIETLPIAGLGDFHCILGWTENDTPLQRTVTTHEVGDGAVYLLSDMSRSGPAEVLHVNAGYIVGMKHSNAPFVDTTVSKR